MPQPVGEFDVDPFRPTPSDMEDVFRFEELDPFAEEC